MRSIAAELAIAFADEGLQSLAAIAAFIDSEHALGREVQALEIKIRTRCPAAGCEAPETESSTTVAFGNKDTGVFVFEYLQMIYEGVSSGRADLSVLRAFDSTCANARKGAPAITVTATRDIPQPALVN